MCLKGGNLYAHEERHSPFFVFLSGTIQINIRVYSVKTSVFTLAGSDYNYISLTKSNANIRKELSSSSFTIF